MNFTIELEEEVDGRWIAEVPEIAGVLVHGASREDAEARAKVLALRVIAEQIEHGDIAPSSLASVSFAST